MGVDSTQRMVANALFLPLTQRSKMLNIIEENTLTEQRLEIEPNPEEKRTSEESKRRAHRLKPLLSPIRAPLSSLPSLPLSPFPISPLNRNILITIEMNEKSRIKVDFFRTKISSFADGTLVAKSTVSAF